MTKTKRVAPYKTHAIDAAIARSHLSRGENGNWIVWTRRQSFGTWKRGPEMPRAQARESLTVWRLLYAIEYVLGFVPGREIGIHTLTGDLKERLNAALERIKTRKDVIDA